MTKDELQDTVLDHWRDTGGMGVAVWVTAVGKTILLKKAADRRLVKDAESVIHYVVPNRLLKKKAKKLLDKRVEVFVINSYVKKPRECDVLLIDEIHRIAAATFSKIFQIVKMRGKNRLPWILGVTASLTREDGKHEIIKKYCPVISYVGYELALENKWISDFEVWNIGIDRPANYDEINNGFRRDLAFFHDSRNLMFKCMYYKGALEFIQGNGLDMKVGEVIGIAKRCYKGMRERNELIYESEEKLRKIIEIVNEQDKKFITFSMSIDFSRKLTEGIKGAVSIDSGMTDKVRDELLNKFEEGEVRVVNSVKIFEEGYDAPELDRGISVSCTSVDRAFIQRLGRILRYIEGKKAIFYCLYLRDTKEKWTLKKAQSSIPGDRVKWI
jgi:superfamily II DNA or RNA helicase